MVIDRVRSAVDKVGGVEGEAEAGSEAGEGSESREAGHQSLEKAVHRHDDVNARKRYEVCPC